MKVLWHLGLGDAIACAPIIAKLAGENDKVEIACWKHNHVSVKSFFINHSNVVVHPFETSNEMRVWAIGVDLMLGCYNLIGNCDQRHDEDFVQWFYRIANLHILEKDKYCPILEASKTMFPKMNNTSPNACLSFIHDDPKRGFNIIGRNGMRPYHDPIEDDKSILSYAGALISAAEIHCIDSSFLHLVEALPVRGKLFYHKYARPDSTDFKSLKKPWKIIK